ncbi:MAG: hypothetical protein MZV65_37455 [Chromatiales bacterium]|nr:hypothetical protein [Chromatiales bacterium]
MMAPRGLRGADRDGPDAGGRQAPLRAQGAAARRRRRPAGRRASCSTRCWLWKARVPLDATGDGHGRGSAQRLAHRASASSPWPHAGAGLFGTGEATIRATQDLMLLAGLPPLVREGDRFARRRHACATPRQATARRAECRQRPRSEPSAGERVSLPAREPVRVTLAPGAARTLRLGHQRADRRRASWTWTFAAESGRPPRDRLKITQKVVPAVPVRTCQATLQRSSTRPLAVPVRALRPTPSPAAAAIAVTLQPRLADGLAGRARLHVATIRTPASSSECPQAVALRDEARWQRSR